MTRLQLIAALRDSLQGDIPEDEQDALRGLRSAIGGALSRGTHRVRHTCNKCGATVNGTRLMRKHVCTGK